MRCALVLVVLAGVANADDYEVAAGGEVGVGPLLSGGVTARFAYSANHADAIILRGGTGGIVFVDSDDGSTHQYYDALIGYRHRWSTIFVDAAIGVMTHFEPRVTAEFGTPQGAMWTTGPWFDADVGVRLGPVDLAIGLNGPSIGARAELVL
ncbi:MAG: hypothetical protein QM831_03925 [Kofleriaceae bacterium]